MDITRGSILDDKEIFPDQETAQFMKVNSERIFQTNKLNPQMSITKIVATMMAIDKGKHQS